MARLSNRLTARFVTTATTPGMYCDGHGLYLQIGPTGSKAWVFRYARKGHQHDLGLGPTHTVSLVQARGKALACRQQLLAGIDPLAEKRRAQQPSVADITFEQCARRYIADKRAEWKGGKSEIQWTQSLTDYVFPLLGRVSVGAIDTGLVMRTLEPIWREKPVTASRTRQRIESVLDWAAARGHRSGENCARWRGHLENLLPKPGKIHSVAPHSALPADEIPALLDELKRRDGVAAQCIAFIALTAVRAGEAMKAKWDEVNFADRVWTIPAARMKGGVEHRVPLSPEAIAILEHLAETRHSDFIFPGQSGALGKGALWERLRDIGYAHHVTIHGLRASFSTWAGDSTGFAREIVEAALAHQVGNAVERSYRRTTFFDKRRKLMEAWARFCTTPRPQAGEVVQFRAG
jgi:integrase